MPHKAFELYLPNTRVGFIVYFKNLEGDRESGVFFSLWLRWRICAPRGCVDAKTRFGQPSADNHVSEIMGRYREVTVADESLFEEILEVVDGFQLQLELFCPIRSGTSMIVTSEDVLIHETSHFVLDATE
jgi:hypothetical protein